MPQLVHRGIDAFEYVDRTFAHEPVNRFRHHQIYDWNHHRTDRRAEIEHDAPIHGFEQLAYHQAAHYAANWIPRCHDRNRHGAAANIREFRGHRVDRREHAAYAEARYDAPERQRHEAVGGRHHVHAQGHHHQATEYGWLAADMIGDAAKQKRTRSHAPELHRQDETEPCHRGVPLDRDAG